MSRRFVITCGVALAIAVGAVERPTSQTPAAPRTDLERLQQQIESLAAGQMTIQKQLAEIRAALRAQEPPPQLRRPAPPIAAVDVVVDTTGAAVKGAGAAKVTIVEFSDYECPFCGRYVRDTLGALDRDYIQTGKVRYAFRNFPLDAIHPHAFKAAVASLCAGDEGKYWDMHDRLFANQASLDAAALLTHGRELSLNAASYEPCVTGDRHADRIRQDQAEGKRAGVDSTPSFLIGLTVAGDPQVRATRIIKGAQPYAAFKTEIDKLLAIE